MHEEERKKNLQKRISILKDQLSESQQEEKLLLQQIAELSQSVELLERAVQQKLNTATAKRPQESQNVTGFVTDSSIAATDLNPVVKEGWLERKQRNQWEKLYCKLYTDGKLDFLTHPQVKLISVPFHTAKALVNLILEKTAITVIDYCMRFN